MSYPYGNQLYAKGRNKFLRGDLTWKSGATGWKAYLIDLQGGTGYTPDFTNDEFLSAIPAAARISSIALVPTDPAAGVADAADVTFAAVTGAVSEAIVIVLDTGDPATSSLVAYIDVATGLPVTPNSGDINVVWDNGANKIFKL